MTFLRDENFWLYVPLILWIGGIFYLSSGRGSFSNILPFVLPLFAYVFSGKDEETLRNYYYTARKMTHFLGYAMLALFASLVFYNSSLTSLARFWYVYAFAVVLVVASGDELRQCFYPNRVGSLSDVALDCLGGLAMIFLFGFFVIVSGIQ